MSDESFRAELRTWLAAHITDEFRERRTMTFQEKKVWTSYGQM